MIMGMIDRLHGIADAKSWRSKSYIQQWSTQEHSSSKVEMLRLYCVCVSERAKQQRGKASNTQSSESTRFLYFFDYDFRSLTIASGQDKASCELSTCTEFNYIYRGISQCSKFPESWHASHSIPLSLTQLERCDNNIAVSENCNWTVQIRQSFP